MLRRGRESITFRLTLLFALVSTTVLLFLGLMVGMLAERHFEELDMELLDGKLELLQHVLEKVHGNDELVELPRQLNDLLVGHHGLSVIVLAPDGHPIFSTGEAEFPKTMFSDGRRVSSVPTLWSNSDGRRFRGIATAAKTGLKGASPALIAVATDTEHHERFMHSFHMALWSVVGLAALLSGFLGWIAAHRGLTPLRKMSQTVADITADHLDHRLPVASIPAELAEVAETLNAMLARLQESFHRLSAFSSDIAHELRTPVSNLLTQTQVTLSKPRTPEEYRDVLASNAEEFERLSRMIADMLFLAKADNDLVVPHRERVDLSAEAEGLLEFYEVLAEEKGIRLTLEGSGSVSGDRLMLRRAIGNLLSNALDHTPAGGSITVRIGSTEGSTTLAVENTGQTIPSEHLPRLFDRFYRADTSRRRLSDGAGLGLAITRSVMRAHGGSVSVRSARGLTAFELRFAA